MTRFQAKNISIGYKDKTLFEDLNFELKTGVLTSLLGSNGIGKSTLLKSISRLIPIKKGTLLLNGKNASDYSNSEFSKQISMVLTDREVNKELKVSELIKLGRQPYTNWLDKMTPKDEQLIQDAMIACEINDLKDHKLARLSDGQLQRAFIARAVVQDTPFIFLDEPSTHLDLYHKVHLFKLLKRLTKEQNKCILFSTHDLDLALQLSDEIILLKDNTLHHGATKDLIEQNVFDHFFDSEDIVFDKTRRQFIIL